MPAAFASWFPAGLFALATLSGQTPGPYVAAHPPAYAGTYAIRLCHGPCTKQTVPYLSGVLVLFTGPLRNAHGETFRAELDREFVNGCFVMNARGMPDPNPMIGWNGFFSWATAGSGVELELGRSPDGGYRVLLNRIPGGLLGTGAIWGGIVDGEGATDSALLAPDGVLADRVGEPDIGRCPPLPHDRQAE